MSYLISAFGVSAMLTLLLVRSIRLHGHLSSDRDVSGPQKFHAKPVPRIGGVGIVFGVLVSAAMLLWADPEAGQFAWTLLACGLPAFVAGLVEDLTKNVSPRRRLIATAASALAAALWLDSAIRYTTIPGLDWIVATSVGATLVTMFVVAGVANAINIIDGFNGLASMCVVMMLIAIAYVGFQVDDTLIATLALVGVGAVFGFFIWNFPAGMIFLGDGGAYFLGFYVAELAILLLHRNTEVSPMFPLLICIYPVFETIFSIYRRRVLRDVSPGLPDGIHLHSLVYRRVVRWGVGRSNAKALTRRNSMTAPYLWLLCMLSVIPAVLWWNHTVVLVGFIFLFACSYVALYWRIVRFKSPRWLVSRQ